MIVDSIEKVNYYGISHRNLMKAFEWVKSVDVKNLELGTINIDGDKIFAIVQQYKTGLPMDRYIETHRRYVDIQYVIEGKEKFLVKPIFDQAIEIPYEEENDVIFYKQKTPLSEIVLEEDMFAIFFPDDAHMGGIQIDSPAEIKKMVIKVEY